MQNLFLSIYENIFSFATRHALLFRFLLNFILPDDILFLATIHKIHFGGSVA